MIPANNVNDDDDNDNGDGGDDDRNHGFIRSKWFHYTFNETVMIISICFQRV